MVKVEFVDGSEELLEDETGFAYNKDAEMFELGTALFPIRFPREFVKSIRVINVWRELKLTHKADSPCCGE